MFESRIEGQARLNPSPRALSMSRPHLVSSFILSNIKMLASTAMPTDNIKPQTQNRNEARQAVSQNQKNKHGEYAVNGRPKPAPENFGAQNRADALLGKKLNRYGQGSGIEPADKGFRFVRRKLTRNLGAARSNFFVDHRNANRLAVKKDGDSPAHVLARDFGKKPPAFLVKFQENRRLSGGRIKIKRGFFKIPAGQNRGDKIRVFIQSLPFALGVQNGVPFGLGLLGLKFKVRRLTDNPYGLINIENSGKLHDKAFFSG